ncbi:hypothetical protein GALMADRAFT_157296 [Galerina marginata CBS 339.88]|uniref:Uncharacterized protein n=1 Tax=Galerina marginata (strain CBS 339.88) TaxID=685588 RepID=A0A067SUM2_GALM3|nr:hypothetical protein GALMADRAFT_157296 [Galerina marginata CBS 339.88]
MSEEKQDQPQAHLVIDEQAGDVYIFKSVKEDDNWEVARQEIRLVKEALAAKLFDGHLSGPVSQVKIVGSVHNTTGPVANRVKDKSHLTVTVNPGRKPAHLYLDPVDGEVATEETKAVKVIW